MDVALDQLHSVQSFVAPPLQTDQIQEVRLKRDQLNEVLLGYLRQVQKESFFSKDSPMIKAILLTKVRDLEFELACMKMYVRIVNFFFFKTEEQQTSLEADLKLRSQFKVQEELKSKGKFEGYLEGSEISWNMYMALIYRIERKKILRSQLELGVFLINILEWALAQLKLLQTGQKKQADIEREFKALYLKPMSQKYMLDEGESEQVVQGGEEEGSPVTVLPKFKG
mmetsp:Transcript_16492/g.28005  ORF Transcript_16492/g.28005 Transcript_16492/m.28005 type:complete len:226 (-) Transcript_16492:159-836(-)